MDTSLVHVEKRLEKELPRLKEATAENRRLLAQFVAWAQEEFGLFPSPKHKSGDEFIDLGYEPNFIEIGVRKEKPGFRLTAKVTSDELDLSSVPPESLRHTTPSSVCVDITDSDALMLAQNVARLAARKAGVVNTRNGDARLTDRITFDPAVCGGRPCIRSMRIRVSDVTDLLAAGLDVQQILTEYPYLERHDVRAALAYASRSMDHPTLVA